MSAKVLLADLDSAFRNSIATVRDPGASGTIEIEHKGIAICEVVTAAAESRALESAANFGVGQQLTVMLATDGGDLTITGSADGSVVLQNAGDVAKFEVALSGSTNVWKTVFETDMLAAARNVEKMTSTALTDTVTVTAAQLLTRILTGVPVSAATYTLPTAALLVAAMPGVKVGDSFTFIVTNNGADADAITIAEGSGGTADGTLTVAQNVVRMFVVNITNVTASSEAYTVYGIG